MVHTAKVFINANLCVGEPKLTDFELKTEVLDALKDGELIAEAMYFGINAGFRAYQDIYPMGSIVLAGQVARCFGSSGYSILENILTYFHLFLKSDREQE